MREFVVGRNEAGMRIDRYAARILGRATMGFVYKMLRKKNIVLNGKKAGIDMTIDEGDVVRFYLSDETFDKFRAERFDYPKCEEKDGSDLMPDIDIVYENDDMVIINKPAGMLSQKSSKDDYSANDMIIDYLIASGQLAPSDLLTFHPSICNRLDRNTSGLLIAGKTEKGLREVSHQLKTREIKKFYLCIVAGDVQEDIRLEGWLIKDGKTNTVTVIPGSEADDIPNDMKGASRIETYVHPERSNGYLSMLTVELITGRTHQIRAHLSSIGHPVIGDTKYGDKKINSRMRKDHGITGQLLLARRMEFPDGLAVEADVPGIFYEVIRPRRKD